MLQHVLAWQDPTESSAKLGFRPTRYRNQLDQRSVALLSALRCWLRLGSHRFVLLCRPRSPKPTEELHSSHWHWSSAGRCKNSSVHHNPLCVPRKKSARTAASMDSELEGARDNTCVWLLLQTFVMMHILISIVFCHSAIHTSGAQTHQLICTTWFIAACR
jgi:hypothetical protein